MSFWGGHTALRHTCTMAHEPRLTTALRALLASQRVAALGTLDAQGLPFVSMVPFAVEPLQGSMVLHVSGLALHTRNLQAAPQVSLMVMEAEKAGAPVHALARVTLVGVAAVLLSDTPAWRDARNAYLERFPEAEPMTQLGDFLFVAITVDSARQVAGFGAARSLDAQDMAQVLQSTGS